MIKKIAIGVGVLLVGFAVFVAMQPSEFRIERSKTIEAPAYVTFNLLNNFHRWQSWSPWEGRDPNMQRKHEGAGAGVGAVYSWAGNDEVGEGRMTIVESQPEKKVVIKLEFLKPWEAINTTIFTLTRKDAGADVTWAMEGQNNFMAKAMCLFMDVDAMVGKDFEAGLTTLKKVAEQEAKEIERARAEKAKLAAQAAAAAAAKVAAPVAVPAQ